MATLELTEVEINDLLEAIEDAQDELCIDLKGTNFPEATAYWKRLEALAHRLETLYNSE